MKNKITKRLLSIAINDYPGGISDLDGCINDQLLIYKICKEVYGFSEFKTLTDEEATKTNIKKSLDWLVTDLPKNSIIMMHFSGHGTSIPCTTKTTTSEIDSMDECLVSYDFNPRNPLRDNELGEQFKYIDPSIHIFVLLDACMSGTGLRGCLPNKSKNRYFRPPPSIMLESGDISIGEELEYTLPTKYKNNIINKPFLVHTVDQGNSILLSGCSETEYAADSLFKNRYHGACTFFTAQTMMEANWNISYKELVTKINDKLDKAGFVNQTPQLECESCFDNLVLGGKP